MGKYRTKPIEVEALTFDEFVEYGKTQVKELTNGMPWSFEYNGHPVTHENDQCYLINCETETYRFTPDKIITGANADGILMQDKYIFDALHKKSNLADLEINNAIALLDECISNGENGMETLYAWFSGEKSLISNTAEWLEYNEDQSKEEINKLKSALEQACYDLNSAHDEICKRQKTDPEKSDWPEWTPQANTIRWAEELLNKKLSKSNKK